MAAEHEERRGLREVAEAAVPGAGRACPVVTAGSGYFDGEGRPYVVRMELPLSAGEMVAAPYGEHERLAPADLKTDGDVWGQSAMVVVQDGLHEVWELADVIGPQEPCHALAAPAWLALCRKRWPRWLRGSLALLWLGSGRGLTREGVQVAALAKGGDS